MPGGLNTRSRSQSVRLVRMSICLQQTYFFIKIVDRNYCNVKKHGNKEHSFTRVFLPPASEGWREVIFSVWPHLFGGRGGAPDPALDGGGYPIQPWMGGGYLIQPWRGYPIQPWTGGVPYPALDGGVPQPWTGGTPSRGGTPSHVRGGGVPPTEIASSCYGYAAGGVPLAFTQEDFLVVSKVYFPLLVVNRTQCTRKILAESRTHWITNNKRIIMMRL